MIRREDRARRLALEVARAARRPSALRALLLDLDGTLAPLVERPELAAVPEPTLAALGDLAAKGWTVAVVSGRPASSAARMVPVAGVRVFGSHGLEGRWSGRARRTLGAELRRRLRAVEAAGRRAAKGIAGAMVETKPSGVGLHDRRVPPGLLAEWRGRVRRLLDQADLEGLEILRGRRVVEIRPRGCSKARVVESFPPAGRLRSRDGSFLAVGDDRTDEDMFRAIDGLGLGVLVGRPRRGTAARRRLASPREVRRFLQLVAANGERR